MLYPVTIQDLIEAIPAAKEIRLAIVNKETCGNLLTHIEAFEKAKHCKFRGMIYEYPLILAFEELPPFQKPGARYTKPHENGR